MQKSYSEPNQISETAQINLNFELKSGEITASGFYLNKPLGGLALSIATRQSRDCLSVPMPLFSTPIHYSRALRRLL